MRTVLALLLLAVAANCYTLKMGGLKGSWATDVEVTSTVAVDMAAPVLVAASFTLEEDAADYAVNATEGESLDTTVYFAFDTTDTSETDYCTVVSQLWDADMNVVSEFSVSDYFGYISPTRYLPQGEYVTTVTCSDPTGNTNWWDSATADDIYSIIYSDHTVDMTPFIASNVEVDDQTGAITYSINDDDIVGDTYYITFDFVSDDSGTDPFDDTIMWAAEISGSWTAAGSSTEQMTWAASCNGYYSGTCTASIDVDIDSEPGVYSIGGAKIWDQAGNMASVPSFTPITITLSEGDHTQTVVSCQTLVLTDPTDIPVVSTTSDSFSITLGCTLKDDVVSATALVSYIRAQQVQMGSTTFEDGGRVVSNGADVTTLNSLDGSLVTDIDIPGGYPVGPYSLNTVTTRTYAGMSQLYTLDLGSASSAAPSVAALLVAVAVALLRL